MEPKDDTLFDENAPAGKDALAEINFDLVDTGRWLLKVIGGPNNGAEFSMQASSTYVIGTDPNSCDIVFHDTSVSRQHARISVTADEKIFIEDLKSRNGTLVEGEPLKNKKQLNLNNVVTLGTTSFIVYDREGEMQTIISPLLPSIVKVLQKEDSKKPGEEKSAAGQRPEVRKEFGLPKPPEKHTGKHGAFIVIAILVGLFAIVGLGTMTLFKSEPVVMEQPVDSNAILAQIMQHSPSVKYTFNKSTGRLLLVGHVLTAVDKNQLLYNLQGLNFIKNVDDTGVIIDEYVWQEINQLLSNNPKWKGITIQSPAPGKFVMTGYLQTRQQAEHLSQYVSENFRYLDLLENHVVVDEDVIASVTNQMQNLGIRNVAAQMSNGELTLTGNLPSEKANELQSLIKDLRAIPGVRVVKNFVTQLPPEATFINISDKYSVTGSSVIGRNLSVVINGHILSKGDTLDGMIITSIKPNKIMLDKDGVHYQIDYGK